MVERRVCTFCGDEIEPGTGRMYIKKDGVVFNFCSSKCFKNLVVLGRVPRRTTWTRYYEREKEVRMKGLAPPEPAEKPKARKVKKAEDKAEEPKAEAKKEEPKGEKKAEEKPKPAKKEEAPKKEAPPKAEKKPEAKKPAPKKTEPAKKEAPKAKEEPKEEKE